MGAPGGCGWQYQWIRHAEPLIAKLRDVLYDLTHGVTDILIKLLVLAQRHAIHTGEERLTVRRLRTIADTWMQLLKAALDALRSGKTERMAKFEDLFPPDSHTAAMMGVIESDARVPSQLSTRRDMRRPVAASATPSPPEARERTRNPVTSTTNAGERIPSEACALAGHEAPHVALGDAGWPLEDALEFSTAYAAL